MWLSMTKRRKGSVFIAVSVTALLLSVGFLMKLWVVPMGEMFPIYQVIGWACSVFGGYALTCGFQLKHEAFIEENNDY